MEEKKRRRAPVILIIVFVLVLAALYAYLYLLPGISDSKSRTVVVNYATVQLYSENKCIVVRSEKVYKTQYAGSVSYYSKEGEKTRQGTMIADIYSASGRESINAETTGIVSFFIDDYEEYFDPSSFDLLDPDEVAKLEEITPKSVKKNDAEADDIVFKLVTSDVWHMIIMVKPEDRQQMKLSQNIIIELETGERFPAVISAVNESENNVMFLADISTYYEKSAQLRSLEAKIIRTEESGLLIPSSAITSNGENIGVYVLGVDGDYTFKDIEIIIETGDETLIEEGGNVRLYDEVLKDAGSYKR